MLEAASRLLSETVLAGLCQTWLEITKSGCLMSLLKNTKGVTYKRSLISFSVACKILLKSFDL